MKGDPICSFPSCRKLAMVHFNGSYYCNEHSRKVPTNNRFHCRKTKAAVRQGRRDTLLELFLGGYNETPSPPSKKKKTASMWSPLTAIRGFGLSAYYDIVLLIADLLEVRAERRYERVRVVEQFFAELEHAHDNLCGRTYPRFRPSHRVRICAIEIMWEAGFEKVFRNAPRSSVWFYELSQAIDEAAKYRAKLLKGPGRMPEIPLIPKDADWDAPGPGAAMANPDD